MSVADRQTDHAMQKCIVIGQITCARAILPKKLIILRGDHLSEKCGYDREFDGSHGMKICFKKCSLLATHLFGCKVVQIFLNRAILMHCMYIFVLLWCYIFLSFIVHAHD